MSAGAPASARGARTATPAARLPPPPIWPGAGMNGLPGVESRDRKLDMLRAALRRIEAAIDPAIPDGADAAMPALRVRRRPRGLRPGRTRLIAHRPCRSAPRSRVRDPLRAWRRRPISGSGGRVIRGGRPRAAMIDVPLYGRRFWKKISSCRTDINLPAQGHTLAGSAPPPPTRASSCATSRQASLACSTSPRCRTERSTCSWLGPRSWLARTRDRRSRSTGSGSFFPRSLRLSSPRTHTRARIRATMPAKSSICMIRAVGDWSEP